MRISCSSKAHTRCDHYVLGMMVYAVSMCECGMNHDPLLCSFWSFLVMQLRSLACRAHV